MSSVDVEPLEPEVPWGLIVLSVALTALLAALLTFNLWQGYYHLAVANAASVGIGVYVVYRWVGYLRMVRRHERLREEWNRP